MKKIRDVSPKCDFFVVTLLLRVYNYFYLNANCSVRLQLGKWSINLNSNVSPFVRYNFSLLVQLNLVGKPIVFQAFRHE